MTRHHFKPNKIIVSLLGPGYGECVLIHLGQRIWLIVDSCVDARGVPVAFQYLQTLGVDPAEDVQLVVATHWHDDHVRGMGSLVRTCQKAQFCCPTIFRKREFLARIGALAGHEAAPKRSGVSEIYSVFSELKKRSVEPKFAMASKRLMQCNDTEVWTLSPSDKNYDNFLQNFGSFAMSKVERQLRVPIISPNEISTVLFIKVAETAILLGADLDRNGWVSIVDDLGRPQQKASIFKVPHHGSKNGHEDRVWQLMLEEKPYAIVAPWHRGRHALPKKEDIERLLSLTPRAYMTAPVGDGGSSGRAPFTDHTVRRTLKESGAKLLKGRQLGAIHLEREKGSQEPWSVTLNGSALHLSEVT